MKRGESVILTIKPTYAFGERGKDVEERFAAIPPNATITVSLELVSFKAVKKVAEDKKVIKKILKKADGYDKPCDGPVVQIRYTAKLQDGTIFEKEGYEGGEPFQFVVDEEQVVAGLDKEVETMKTGEIALITIEPEYGFGNIETQRDLAVIPPNSTLIYEVEMVSFTKEKESWDIDTTEKIEASKQKKEQGNSLFKVGKYQRAAKK